MIPAKDISQYQGNWQDTDEPIVMIKMGGGDAGLYMDSKAAQDYQGAVTASRAVGGYWFAGGGNASAEASYFLRCMEPLAENDVYALDIEHGSTWDLNTPEPVAWVTEFVNYVHNKIGVWPLVYMNLATLNGHNWDSILTNCGLWLADWAVSPNDTIPTSHTYVMQQYSDGPNYDHDEWFGTLEQFKAYGYHTPVPEPAPPQPTETTTTTLPPTTSTTTITSTTTTLPPIQEGNQNWHKPPDNKPLFPPPKKTIWQSIIAFFKLIFGLK